VKELTKQEKIDRLVSTEENHLAGEIAEYRSRLERKTDKEINEEYMREYE